MKKLGTFNFPASLADPVLTGYMKLNIPAKSFSWSHQISKFDGLLNQHIEKTEN